MAPLSSCSCPCAADPTRVAGLAAGVGATVAWYALPDYVRSRPLRGLIKTGLLGVIGWSLVSMLPDEPELAPYDDEVDCSKGAEAAGEDPLEGVTEAAGEDPLEGVTEAAPRELAVLGGAVAGSALVTLALERWLFRRGERRRASGVRFAHTRQGLALGGLEAALTALTFGAGSARERLSKS